MYIGQRNSFKQSRWATKVDNTTFCWSPYRSILSYLDQYQNMLLWSSLTSCMSPCNTSWYTIVMRTSAHVSDSNPTPLPCYVLFSPRLDVSTSSGAPSHIPAYWPVPKLSPIALRPVKRRYCACKPNRFEKWHWNTIYIKCLITSKSIWRKQQKKLLLQSFCPKDEVLVFCHARKLPCQSYCQDVHSYLFTSCLQGPLVCHSFRGRVIQIKHSDRPNTGSTLDIRSY